MYTTPLSPVMEESLRSVEPNCINFLQTNNAATLADYLNEKIIQNLLNSTATLIVVSDDYDLGIPSKILSKNKLAHLSIAWNDQNPLDHKSLERIRILSRLHSVERNRHVYEHLHSYASLIKSEIQSILDAYNKPIDKKKNLKDIISILGSLPKYQITEDLIAVIDKIKSQEDIVNSLVDLEHLYQERFELLSEGIVSGHIYSNKTSLVKARNEISVLFNFVNEIGHDFAIVKAEILSEVSIKIDQEHKLWTGLYEEIREAYYTHDIDQSKLDFASLINQKLSGTKHFTYLKLPPEITQNLEWNNGISIINGIKDLTTNKNAIAEQAKKNYFKRLTPFNIKNVKLDAIIAHTKELKEELLNSDAVDININEQVLTLTGLEEEIKNANRALKKAYGLLSDNAFNTYKRKQNALGIDDQFIEVLKSNGGKTWGEIYQDILFNAIIYNQESNNGYVLQNHYDKLVNLNKGKKQAAIDIIHNIYCKIRDEATTNLKLNQSDLYKSLFNSKESSLTISNIFYLASEFLTAYYPILIIKQCDVKNILVNIDNWSNVIFYDSKKLSFEEIRPFCESSMEVSIATSKAIDLNSIQENISTNLFISQIEKLVFARPFSMLQRSERYQQARALAHAMYNVVGPFNVYQLKNKCIISLLNSHYNDRIVESIPQDYINVLCIQSNNIEDLMEAMLITDTEVIIMIENGVLNDHNVKYLEWQFHVLTLLKEAGVKLVDVPTYGLIKNFKKTYHTTLESLLADLQNIRNHELIEAF